MKIDFSRFRALHEAAVNAEQAEFIIETFLGPKFPVWLSSPKITISNNSEMPQKHFLSPQESLWPGDPFDWSVEQVCGFVFLHDPTDTKIAAALRREEIDGPAFLLLTQDVSTKCLNLTQTEIARLCHIVEAAKYKFAQLHIEPCL